jgi:hypothetical protein
MKRLLVASAVAIVLFAASLQAQEGPSYTRIESQHKPPSGMEKQLAKHEENLIKTLGTENVIMQAQAVQTIRDLEQMYPKYTFKASVQPLAAKLKDEKADGIVRRLSALALDELHSDAGDAAIRDIAGSTQDKGLQMLCNALLVRSEYNK